MPKFEDLVLVLPGWPRGFCPLHALEREPCGSRCVEARILFRESATALDEYWRSVGRTEPFGEPNRAEHELVGLS